MTTAVDGRSARRDRNAEVVLDAVHELFVAGELAPSLDAVAVASGVSLRSLYRYFPDIDELWRAAIARRVELTEPLFELPDLGVGSLSERIEAFVDHRIQLHDQLGPSVRAALLQASQPLIAAQIEARRKQLRSQAEQQFKTELAKLDGSMAVCVDTLCQFESIELIRSRPRMSRIRTRSILIDGVTSLLQP